LNLRLSKFTPTKPEASTSTATMDDNSEVLDMTNAGDQHDYSEPRTHTNYLTSTSPHSAYNTPLPFRSAYEQPVNRSAYDTPSPPESGNQHPVNSAYKNTASMTEPFSQTVALSTPNRYNNMAPLPSPSSERMRASNLQRRGSEAGYRTPTNKKGKTNHGGGVDESPSRKTPLHGETMYDRMQRAQERLSAKMMSRTALRN
jgi:hypothetical protein